ncbi:hypothetical protein GCM10027271_22660 [Saccharopolyspora gloriosae]|uniref:Uncharacterized protein n=1 Tax=Saccharopolyspora gloriosae TaxID=455344 RepID=A0A840NEX8_9PSEU|nr:hypothetical protein [Saccharopolyspora gloriosae]MBB5070936.1 hypothetical protein [Saccharopolyspora gloriosae]
MPAQHTITVPCRDIAFRDRAVHLGRIRRGISLRVPEEAHAILDLAQAEELHRELGAAINGVRVEVEAAGS